MKCNSLKNNSSPLDVHKWSDHTEANKFVDVVFESYFPEQFKSNRRTRKSFRTDLKVLLLDLYVSWNEDPKQTIGVGMSNSFYKKGSRYNALHVSYKLINIVNELSKTGLIGFKPGSEWSGKVSRIWPKANLIRLFEGVKFSVEDIKPLMERECIILRNKDKKDIEYEESYNTHQMREHLRGYNELLHRTFIDIPSLDKPVIQKKGDKNSIRITQNNKFVRRIFHNSTFEEGGRYYGGWWQNIPKEFRKEIYINDMPTIEDDYSALHLMLVYSKFGLEYDWKEDPYHIPIKFINSEEEERLVGKLFLLTALNAKTTQSGFKAARSEFTDNNIRYPGEFTDEFLNDYLNKVINKHPPLEDYLCSNAGVELMNIDSQIIEKIVNRFTKKKIPILCLHDSFIVSVEHDDELKTQMLKSIKEVSGNNNIQIIRKNVGLNQINKWKYIDREYYLSNIKEVGNKKVKRTKGYELRKKKFYNL